MLRFRSLTTGSSARPAQFNSQFILTFYKRQLQNHRVFPFGWERQSIFKKSKYKIDRNRSGASGFGSLLSIFWIALLLSFYGAVNEIVMSTIVIASISSCQSAGSSGALHCEPRCRSLAGSATIVQRATDHKPIARVSLILDHQILWSVAVISGDMKCPPWLRLLLSTSDFFVPWLLFVVHICLNFKF